MRLPITAHTSRPWRIHAIAPDFHVEDVWALPTPGGPDDFGRLVATVPAATSSTESSPLTAVLFAVRWRIGALLGWDRAGAGLDTRVTSLRDRLPADLRDGPKGPDLGRFEPLYLAPDEWAAEIANGTVHAVLHLGWVPDEAVPGGWRGQLAVLVKPNGPLGRLYLAAIKPFRYAIVYPALLRRFGAVWPEQVTTA